MTQSENSPSDNRNKTLSAKELRALLLNPSPEFIKEKYDRKSILISDYYIEDEHLILDDSVTVNLPLTFKNCTFKSDNFFLISGLTCNESLTFEGGTISDCIYFDSGSFNEVSLKYVHVKSIQLWDCTFGKVSISCYDVDDIWVSGAKLDSLHIGEHLVGYNVSNLVIFTKKR